ncbi:MAG TPA: MOSC and FAD-binding oxidoreductase domain-containing protein [Jatrophihabitantaceae bacterium]
MASLLSLNVGLPKNVSWQGRTVYTGVWKRPVQGSRLVRRLNVDGDGQGDLKGHGGEQRAVLVYQLDSYRHWQDHFGWDAIEYGQFGENFTVDGLPDDEVCIGDRYRIGEAEFEVSQPRVTCFRVGMRLGEPRLPALLVSHHRPGFYMRVIGEGEVQAGDEIVRTRVGPHAITVADIDALLYLPDRDRTMLVAALDIPALSPGWQQSFRELLAASDGGPTAAVPPIGVEPGWPGFRRMRVTKIVSENATVDSVYLTSDDGQALPSSRAGQYLAIRATAAGDPAPVRSYSLSSRPDGTSYRISVKREPHGVVSGYLHSKLRPGALLDVAAPRGEFVLTDEPNPALLISAGIGVTPVLAMLYELAGAQTSREVWWIHVTRDAAQHSFADEAHRLLQSLPHAHECVFFTAPGADLAPSVLPGRPTPAALAALGLPTDASAYVCGPASFMTDIGAALGTLGIRTDHVHTELFAALPAVNPGIVDVKVVPPHPPAGAAGTGPQITFSRSGLTVRWSDQQNSLLELAEACDVPTRWSCRTGVCHTCVTPILSGAIDYDPEPLELPANSEALVCCARPRTDIVLDL